MNATVEQMLRESIAQDDAQSIAHEIDELAERIRALRDLGEEQLLPIRYSALGLWNAASLAESYRTKP